MDSEAKPEQRGLRGGPSKLKADTKGLKGPRGWSELRQCPDLTILYVQLRQVENPPNGIRTIGYRRGKISGKKFMIPLANDFLLQCNGGAKR